MLKRLLEERKMPLTITEEMIKQDPFSKKDLKGELKKENLKQRKRTFLTYTKSSTCHLRKSPKSSKFQRIS